VLRGVQHGTTGREPPQYEGFSPEPTEGRLVATALVLIIWLLLCIVVGLLVKDDPPNW
jgi:hypothetical protein